MNRNLVKAFYQGMLLFLMVLGFFWIIGIPTRNYVSMYSHPHNMVMSYIPEYSDILDVVSKNGYYKVVARFPDGNIQEIEYYPNGDFVTINGDIIK